MIRLLLLLLIMLVAAPAVPAGMLTITHQSAVLGRERTLKVYVPDSREPGQRFPVLYLLHGAYGSHEDWPRGGAAEAAERFRTILVFPDGGQFGWYVDSPVEKESQMESYIVRELVPEVDRLLPTIGTRETRGIMGLSMGGHGAITLASKHPDVFGSASSLSGILKITNHPGKWQIAGRLGPLEGNEAVWAANSAWELAPRLVNANVRILFDCGREDTATGAIDDNRQYHERLRALGVPHIWREFDGNHTWPYWTSHLPEHLAFHTAAAIEHLEEERWFDFYYSRLSRFLDENAKLALERPTSPTICLFGSSSMQGLQDDLFPGYHVFNRGISADRLGITGRGMSHRMEESVFDVRPDYLFFKIGRNDLMARRTSGEPSMERMLEEYEKMLVAVQTRAPETKVWVISSFPTRGERYSPIAEAIVTWNSHLAALARRLKVPYIDAHTPLREADSPLLREEYSRDGLHLNDAGEQLVAALMLAEIERVRVAGAQP